MYQVVPKLIGSPYPMCCLCTWLFLVFRNERVAAQLLVARGEALKGGVPLLVEDSLLSGMNWGAFAAKEQADNAVRKLAESGLLLCAVPGSPVWKLAQEGAAL